jgi:predicted permease
MAFDAFALILTMLALGMLFARLKALPANAAEALNLVVLYVCLPAAVLIYVPRLHVDASLLGVIVTPWLLAVVTVGLVTLATRTFGFRRDEHAVLLLCVALGNTSFIGYPMVRALLGEDALPYAVVYDQFGTFVLLSTFGLYVLAKYGGRTAHRPPDPVAHPQVPAGVGVAAGPDRHAGAAAHVDRRSVAETRGRPVATGDAGGGLVDPVEAAA